MVVKSQAETSVKGIVNLTETFGAWFDHHSGTIHFRTDCPLYLGDSESVWTFLRKLGGEKVRILYLCQNGTTRDIEGRQGVYHSYQDGPVSGNGTPMSNHANLSISFWTKSHSKINTGAGQGYRTLLATGILAVRYAGFDYVTSAFLDLLA